MLQQTELSRRDVFRLTGSAAGVATLAAVAPAGKSMVAARALAQAADETAAGQAPRFAYVGTYTRSAPGGWSAVASVNHPEGVMVFSVGAGLGDLNLVQTVPSDNPSYVSIHPSEQFLYVSNEIADYEGEEKGSLEAYAIDDETGELTFINRVACGTIPAQTAVSPGGDYLAVATYVGGAFELYPISEDGGLGEASSVAQQEGSGPHARQTAPHVHSVVFDPSGQYLVGADLGTDHVKSFTYDGGELVEVGVAMVAPGSGPRHVAFHPNGQILYVICELTATISSFAFDPASGAFGDEMQTVSTVPQNFPPDKSCAELQVHPSGKFLYGSNRKFEDHPLADAIVAYSIDDAGMLSLIGYTTHGIAFPRGFSMEPSGRWLYAMGQKSDEIVQFYIDPSSGVLIPTGFTAAAMVPVSIAFKA